jgi:serine/threonine-protein kinase
MQTKRTVLKTAWLITIASFSALASPQLSVAQNLTPEQIDLAHHGVRILNTYCKRCHGDNQMAPGLDMNNRDGLLKHKRSFLVAGDPSSSLIWKRMIDTGNSMPPEKQPQPSAEDKELFKQWIADGAHFPPQQRKKREFLGDRTIVKMIAQDLDTVKEEAIEYTRYFTLAHLWNDVDGVEPTTDEDLRYVRAAVSKLINSLSYQPRIVPPRIVDAEYGTLMAIDLRDYGWTVDDWDQILNHYPYGLRVGGQDEKRIIRNTGGCATPVIRADWFVNTCSRPPLYHELLDIPNNAKVLERKLGVDIPQNFRSNRMMRAAFSGLKSGVSEQNRMIERHDQAGAGRFYWKSYDMLPGAEREHDFLRSPLGPIGMDSKYDGAAFAHDGGEIIFSLPNGLQAYMLVDGNDQRIDIGPQAVVRDPNQLSGSFEIVNGVSCMGCHKQGMIDWNPDFVRPEFERLEGQRVADKVLEIYPTDEYFLKVADEDRNHFLGAMKQACGDFLLGSDRNERARNYHQFFHDVMLSTKTQFDSEKLWDFVHIEMQDELYSSVDPRAAIQLLAAKGKEKMGWNISLDAVLGMYELNPMNKRQTVGDFADPVTQVAGKYFKDITLDDACRELGLPENPEQAEAVNMLSISDLKAFFRSRPSRQMGLSALAGKDGSIARKSWEQFYGKVATAMDLGIPLEYSTHYQEKSQHQGSSNYQGSPQYKGTPKQKGSSNY